MHFPDHARKLKDNYVGDHKITGLSPGMLNMWGWVMLTVCDIVEEPKKMSG